jgi:hypothetical protein
MSIDELVLTGGVTDIKRSSQIDSLNVDSLKLKSDVSIIHLELLFDNLRSLQIYQRYETHPMKDITLPPKAMNWTGGFEIEIYYATALNLTSIYGSDDQGNQIQT